jgi:hypothetical protein
MSEDTLSIQGDLEETTVPDLFRSLVRSSETGIVSLEASGRTDTIYFDQGKIVYASSTDPDMGLAETLLRGGELNLKQYEHAMERLVVSRRIGGLLCELGYLDPDGLIRAVERQASEIVLDAITYRSGAYTIEFTSEFSDEIMSLPLTTERLILEGVKRIEFWSLIWRGISRMDRTLQQVPGADMRSYALELGDEEGHILSLLTEPQTVAEICAHSYLTNFVTCRTLWGLLAVNFVQDGEGGEAMYEKRAVVESEYALEGLVERYNTLFQKIFNIVFQRIGDHTYDFVDRVMMRHVAPEHMPFLSGMTLVNEARIDFDQLYNNLVASGSSNHAAVAQSVLDELLAGWVFEVKEFGPEMEAEIVRLANSIRLK